MAAEILTNLGSTISAGTIPTLHKCPNMFSHTVAYTVTNMGSTALVVGMEGSLDGSNFFSLRLSNSGTTIGHSTNGTYYQSFANTPMCAMRFRVITLVSNGTVTPLTVAPVIYSLG